MKKRQKEIERVYEEQWDGGKGSHHPDYDPEAVSWLVRGKLGDDRAQEGSGEYQVSAQDNTSLLGSCAGAAAGATCVAHPCCPCPAAHAHLPMPTCPCFTAHTCVCVGFAAR